METSLVAIPDDALRRLPLRSLAVARCVCKAWRGIVDDRGLLLAHLLPHSVRGIFINYIDHGRPHLFARPSPAASPEIDDMLSFLPNNNRRDWWSVMDHCDGLLLCDIDWGRRLCVCNPATQRWTLLPAGVERLSGYSGAHLVFDPAASPHYDVVLIPAVPKKPVRPYAWRKAKKKKRHHEIDGPFCLKLLFSSPVDDTLIPDGETQDHGEEEFHPATESAAPALPCVEEDEDEDKEPDDPDRLMDWPPSPWQLNVFSSRIGQWEAKSFVREGKPVGTVEDVRLDLMKHWRRMRRGCTVYRNGTLYVHYRGSFIMRFSLSNDKYQVINTPTNIGRAKPYLGRLEKEVCFGLFHEGQLYVWILKESHENIEWVLRYQDDLRNYAHYVSSRYYNGTLMAGHWVVKERNISEHDSNYTAETLSQESFECNSDNDETLSKESSECNSDNDETLSKESSEWNPDNDETLSKESFEWNSDNDDIISVDDGGEENNGVDFFDILGFHPYKKVVFLANPAFCVMAYHMNTSKAQYLGNSRPHCYYHNFSNGIYESFVYTPCMIGELQEDNIGTSTS